MTGRTRRRRARPAKNPMLRIPTSHFCARCQTLLLAAARWAESRVGLASTLVFAAVFLSPQFIEGYGGDDILNSSAPGYLLTQGISLSDYLSQEVHGSICGGRFYPLAIVLCYGVHCFVRSAAAFHTFVFALVLTDLALHYYLLRLWRLEKSLASLGTLFLALLFQLRCFYDPILQFAGMLPILVAQILVAMVCFERYLGSRRLAWLSASLVAFATSLITYEIAFMVTPVFIVMACARRRDWRRGILDCQSHGWLAIAIVAFTLGIRYHFGWRTDGAYSPRFDLAAICRTTALQASAAMPLSYALLSIHRVDIIWERRLVGSWQNWAIFFAAGALSWAYLRQFAGRTGLAALPASITSRKPSLGMLALVGGAIWILPGVPIALSPKYQEAVGLGLGYLPVFLQYFGVALLAIVFVLWARERAPRLWPQLVWGIVAFNALVAMVTFDANATVAARMDAEPMIKSMSLVESACHEGLFDAAPTGSTIWSVQAHGWMCGGPDRAGGHLSKTLGRLMYGLIGVPSPDWLVRRFTPDSIPAPTFVMNDLWPNLDWAYVVLGAVDPEENAALNLRMSAGDTSADAYPIRSFRLFLSGSYAPRSAQPDQLAIASVRRDAAGQPTWCLGQWIDLANLKVVSRSRSGVILEGAFASAVDMRLVCVIEAKDVAGRLKADPTQALMAK